MRSKHTEHSDIIRTVQDDVPPNMSSQAAFARMAAFTSENLPWIMEMHSLFGYRIPDRHNAPFLRFHHWLYDLPPKSIVAWKEKNPRWFKQIQDGVLGSPRDSCGAAYYHAENLNKFERAAIEAAKHIPSRLPPGSVNAMGLPKLDFEYQAHILAFDRYFEHLTLGLNGFFKDQSHDFEGFGNSLRRRAPNPVATALADVYFKFRPRFEPSFSKGGRSSVRSQILHRGTVSAGCLNIYPNGEMYFIGGGDELPPPYGPTGGRRLSELNAVRFELMHEYTSEMLMAFTDAIPEWESWAAQSSR